jgi:hypothetical protein
MENYKEEKLYRGAGKCIFQIISRRWITSAADEFRKSFFWVYVFRCGSVPLLASQLEVRTNIRTEVAFLSLFGICVWFENWQETMFLNCNLNIVSNYITLDSFYSLLLCEALKISVNDGILEKRGYATHFLKKLLKKKEVTCKPT